MGLARAPAAMEQTTGEGPENRIGLEVIKPSEKVGADGSETTVLYQGRPK